MVNCLLVTVIMIFSPSFVFNSSNCLVIWLDVYSFSSKSTSLILLYSIYFAFRTTTSSSISLALLLVTVVTIWFIEMTLTFTNLRSLLCLFQYLPWIDNNVVYWLSLLRNLIQQSLNSVMRTSKKWSLLEKGLNTG